MGLYYGRNSDFSGCFCAINNNQVEVTFNTEVKTVKPADFTVTTKADGTYAFVTKAEVKSTDKKVVTLTFANAFTDKTTYNLKADGVVAVNDKVSSNSTAEFTYAKADVQSVEFTSTTIKTGDNIKDHVKVTDKLGRDITKEVELEVATSDATVLDSTGLSQKEGKAVISVSVKGTEVKTANTTVTVSNAIAKTFVGYHLAAKVDAPATTEAFKKVKTEDVVTSVNLGDSAKVLNLYYLDQYGKSINVVNGTGATYTSVNPNVVVVNADGTITPVSVGTGAVKVKIGEVETTIFVEVKAAAKVSTMKVDKSSVSAATGAVSSTFKVSFEDQYAKAANVDAKYLTVKSSNEAVAKAATTASGSVSEATYTLEAIKEGTANITVTYDDGTNKFEKVVAVTVTKAGSISGYEIVTSTTALDVDAAKTEDKNDATSGTIKVYSVDANGNRLSELSADGGVTVTFADDAATKAIKDQLTLSDSTDTLTFADKAVISKATSATVVVKVGTLTVGNATFSIKDSTATVSSLKFDSVALPALEVADTVQTELQGLVKIYDQYGAEVTDKSGLVFEYVLANQANGFQVSELGAVALAETTDLKKDSTADIVITKVTNGTSTTNLISSPVVVKAVVKGDSVAPTAPTVNAVDSDDLAVTGTAEAGSTVEVYAGEVKLGTATADDKGAYSVEISAQAKDTKLTVKSIDAAGNSSSSEVTVTAAPVA